jgi:hypothetical protein
MGRRSGVAETEEQVGKMTLDSLNAEIESLLRGAYSGGQGAQAHKAFFQRAVWLEKMREKLHGIPAKRRLWRDR